MVEISKESLKNAVKKVRPGVSANDTIGGMGNYVFYRKYIVSYSNRMTVRHPISMNLSAIVKATDLNNLLNNLSAKDLSIQEKGDTLEIRTKKSTSKLSLFEDKEMKRRILMVNKSLRSTTWIPISTSFVSSLEMCAEAAIQKDTGSTLSYIFVQGNTALASDNSRIARAEFEGSAFADSLLIPAKEVKHIRNRSRRDWYL